MAIRPYFKFYASDWLSSTKVAVMSLAEQGAYVNLLCHQWNSEDCSLPDDDEALAALSGMREGWFNGGCQKVRACFTKHPAVEGRIANEKLLAVYETYAQWSEKSREGGRKSGVARRLQSAKGGSTKREPNANQTASKSQVTSHKSLSKKQGKKVGDYTPEFEEFWQAVGAHKRKSKGEACRRWVEAVTALKDQHDDPVGFLKERARAYYASPEGRTQYANGPAPWLYQGRYDDDPAAWERDEADGKPRTAVGPGQRHPEDLSTEKGSF